MRPDNVQELIADFDQHSRTIGVFDPNYYKPLLDYIATLERPVADSAVECATEVYNQCYTHNDPMWREGDSFDIPKAAALITAYAAACVEKGTAGLVAEVHNQTKYKNEAYAERNKLVRLLASIYPSGIKKTAIEGWDEAWHWCVYIDLPSGQASWHFHVDELLMFQDLPAYEGEWDGHTTEEKYEAVLAQAYQQKASQ